MKKKKRRKIKKKVIILFFLIIVLIVLTIGLILYKSTDKKEITQEVVNEIPGFGYTLKNNQPKKYKELFKQLSKELKKEEINYDEYAKIISQMFIIDFYNLENKTSKNDVGGTEFVYTEKKENFILQATDTVYKYIETNFDNKRNQELPKVKDSEIINTSNEKYSFGKIKDDNAYIIKVKLEYEKSMDYPEEITVKLLKNEKKLEVYYME